MNAVIRALAAKAVKPDPTLIPWRAVWVMAEVFTFGRREKGYQTLPWEIENGPAIYRRALLRHAIAWASGEELDEDGRRHLDAILANAAALVEMRERSSAGD